MVSPRVRARLRSPLAWTSALVLVVLLCLIAVRIRVAGSPVASVWAGAGLGTVLALRVQPRRRPLLLAAFALAWSAGNLLAGRPLLDALGFGAVSLAEPLVVSWWFGRRPVPVRLRDLGDVARLVAAAVVGAVLAGGLGVVLIGVLLRGRSASDAVGRLHTIGLTYLAATLIIAPLLLLPRRGSRAARGAERCGQWVAALLVTAVVFGLHQTLPIAFLLLPPLVWGAVRSSPRESAVQVLGIAGLVTVLTAAGRGPFAGIGHGSTAGAAIELTQAFLVVVSLITLTVSFGSDERRRSAQALASSEALYRGGFADAMLGMLLVRFDGSVLRVLELNAVACRLTHRRAAESIGTAWCRQVVDEDLPRFEAGFLSVLDGSMPGWHGEVVMLVGGERRWMEIALAPSGHRDGDPVLSVQMMDVTERRTAHERLAKLAMHDSLTGLPNRALLLDRLATMLRRAERSGGKVTVLLIDLDGFKQVNDVGGHELGDQVLVETADLLRELLRAEDTVARLGGDEFVVAVEGLTARTAGDLVARVHHALQRSVPVGGVLLQLAASVGAATSAEGTTATGLLREADARMYDAKRARCAAVPTPRRSPAAIAPAAVDSR